MKLTDILLKIKEILLSAYPQADMHFFNVTEEHDRPSFLLNPILNMTKLDNYYLINRILSIEIMCFMELEDNEKVGYETKLKLIDNLYTIFAGMKLEVKDRALTFEYEIKEVGGETSVILDFKFTDDRPVLVENYELMQKVLINEREV